MSLIIDSLNLEIKAGEVTALMGPNGSGKTSLALGIIGHPDYKIKGKIWLDKKDISRLMMPERVRQGLFLSWQNPTGIRGVTVRQVLRRIKKDIVKIAAQLKINRKLLDRDINVNFSGGEKKKIQLLELLTLKPKYAILDEIDSGLDADNLKILGQLNQKEIGILLITHQTRVFKYLKPKTVLVMKGRKIVKKGGEELIRQIEREGYKNI